MTERQKPGEPHNKNDGSPSRTGDTVKRVAVAGTVGSAAIAAALLFTKRR